MREFFDREIATKEINLLLAEHTTPWIVLAGSRNSGKTEFAKRIAQMNTASIVCSSQYETTYACSLIDALEFKDNLSLRSVITDFAKKHKNVVELFNQMGVTYVEAISKAQMNTVIKSLIKADVSSGLFSFAHYLGESITSVLKCIFLDDFHRCDYDSYIWILELWNSIIEGQPTIIAICNFELNWESGKLANMFRGVTAPISIEKFDSGTAFYNILSEHFEFANTVKLETVADRLFRLYDGNSRMLFETIKLLAGKRLTSDDEMASLIYSTAQNIHLHRFEELGKVHLLVLRLLSFCPQPILKQCLIETLELVEPIATQILNQLYENNFIDQLADRRTGRTRYTVKDDFVKEIIREGCSRIERYFFETKIFRAILNGKIEASIEQTIELALTLEEESVAELFKQYISQANEGVNIERKAYYLDRIITIFSGIPTSFITTEYADLLYQYGYYQSAARVIEEYLETSPEDYQNLLLLGDIQHLLLSPNASNTFKKASEIQGISISDKLKAINRRIMALNQEHQEEYARELYLRVLNQYEDCPCDGLVELYRNTNNSFGYNDAINYTLKGYALAQRLDNDLEAHKCLHNLCMIQLQYGRYGEAINDKRLNSTPSFVTVLDYFSRWPIYRHERPYPLLDLGTSKMFEYVKTHDEKCLSSAKSLYSQAQLYAKSFYARNIAETGLLIINSYQSSQRDTTYARNARISMYNRYEQSKDDIKDYRVHRKLLLSFALSAIITHDVQEATSYLAMAHPYIFGAETLRYNRLCTKAGCTLYVIDYVFPEDRYELYYGSDEIVPWLISFGH